MWTDFRISICRGWIDQRLSEPSVWPRQRRLVLTQVRDVARTMYSSVKPTVATGFVIHSAKSHQKRKQDGDTFTPFFQGRFSLTIVCLARSRLGNLDDPDLTITAQDGNQPDLRVVRRRDGAPL